MKKDILILFCLFVIVVVTYFSVAVLVSRAFVSSVRATVSNYDVFGNGSIKDIP